MIPDNLLFIDEFEVRVTPKRVKNLNMRVVPPDGHLEVSVPARMGRVEATELVTRFVRERAPWIREHQRRVLESPSVRADGADAREVAQWRAVVAAAAPVLVERWEPVLGVRAGRLAYRNMRSRWGSCQPATGRICLNVRLALYPPECLEYVVVHELAHLRVAGHGPAFWQLVESCLPDYRTAKAKLR